ncbi:helix-turn-helix domain-containing protein [Enterococcus sp. AZ101]|uniref:helix-turn-helix domain-containing protein n=1 Tax=Enterococcus sp. AZ101 TaxID=2774742 RepID=UPI003D2D43C9
MNKQKLNIANNILYLRRINNMSVEKLSNELNISRQAVAKWEHNESIPDVLNCIALAELFDVTIDELLHFDGSNSNISMAPKGKHFFGTTIIEKDRKITIPEEAIKMLNLEIGNELVVLGDENPDTAGIALVSKKEFMKTTEELLNRLYPKNKMEKGEMENGK